jgi:hypothetical protein
VWNFTTTGIDLVPPVLVSPPDKSTGVSLNVLLEWNEVKDAVKYQVQISGTEDMKELLLDTAITQLNLKAGEILQYNTVYYWRVRAVNGNVLSDWSQVWSFITVVAPPEVPVLLTPENNSTGVDRDTALSWLSVTGAEKYQVVISTRDDFSDVVLDTTITGIPLELRDMLSYDTKYFWHVRAANSGGESDWSETWNFTTGTGTIISGNIDSPEFTVYPNPSKDWIFVRLADLPEGNIEIDIINSSGQKVKALHFGNVMDPVIRIDLQDLHEGLYYLILRTDKLKGQKIIVKK